VNCHLGNRQRSVAVQYDVMMRRLALPLLAVVAGLTAACGSAKVDVSDQPAGGVPYPHRRRPGGRELSTRGGFVPEGTPTSGPRPTC
jgi:hypothetical protein